MTFVTRVYAGLASLDQIGDFVLRGGLVVVLLWIGILKFVRDTRARALCPLYRTAR